MPVQAVPLPNPDAPRTMATLRADIKTRLGNNTIDLELTEGDLTACIDDAIQVLNHERPQVAWGTISGYSQTSVAYPITAPGLYGIIDVDWARGTNCDPSCDPFAYDDPAMRAGMMSGGLVGQVSDVLMQTTYIAQTRQLGGKAPDWDTRWVRNQDGSQTLYLMLADLPPGARVMYEYVYLLIATDDPNIGVIAIPPNDVDWVRRYAVARAKQILARVLRKYGGGINMPDGGTEQLDGNELMQEGVQEQAELKEDIHKRRRPILPRSG